MSSENVLVDVGVANTNTSLHVMRKYADINEFLHAHDTLPIRSTPVPNASSFLDFTFDMDGICVEIEKLQGLQGGVHYLFLPRLCGPNLKRYFHFLKKHMDLQEFTVNGLTDLKNCVGHTRAYVDGGYHLLMMALPTDIKKPDSRLLKQDLYEIMALELLNSVVENFQQLLKILPEKEMVRPTIRKQGSFDTSTYHVLRRDATFIMNLLDRAVEGANKCHFLRVAFFLNQFGQKDLEPLDISDIMDPCQVTTVSVHFACNVRAKVCQTHILFSRCGLEELVGLNGTLFTALGIHEATNFQSNLNNQPIDVSSELLSVLETHGKLTGCLKGISRWVCGESTSSWKNVSGAIVTCGLSHPRFHLAVQQRASRYLRHMRDLHDRMVGQLACRLE